MVSGTLAGQKGSTRQLTRDKLETVMQTNYFGHFLLTNLLKEALKKSDDPRVVNVSSIYNMKGVIDVDNLNGEVKFDGELVSRAQRGKFTNPFTQSTNLPAAYDV